MLARTLGGVVVGVGIAAGAAWLLGVKPDELAKSLAGVPAWCVVLCAASSFVVLALQSLRWHAVMKPVLGLRYPQAYRAQVVGYMFNALLPARGGDLLRVQYLGRRTGKSRATILATEIVDRWLDWWGWIPLMLVMIPIARPPSWMFTALALFGGGLTAWAITMVVLGRRGYQPRAGSRFGAVYGAFQTGIGAFRSRRTLAIAFFLAPLPWIWEALVIQTSAHGFGIDLGFARSFCVLIGFNAAMAVPSPGAIGTVETGGTAALMFFGIDQSKALAFILVYHFAQLLPGIAAGAAILIAEGERLFGKVAVAEAAAEPSPSPSTPTSIS
jgi:glycosyltransferase 2 family protein